MPPRGITDTELQEAALHIEKRRRRETIRTVIIVQLITLAILILALLIFGKWINDLLDNVHRQNVAQLVAIEEARAATEADAKAAVEAAEAQQEIIERLGERIVPKSDILALEREVEQLQVIARNLRRAVRSLNQTLVREGVAGGG